ncbi:MAG: hypothetical protein QOF02_3072 [Blastocatellia bacterium]|jgi:hypothetical protein|nr:hypothetical protein [Blastocatellia bacterium]
MIRQQRGQRIRIYAASSLLPLSATLLFAFGRLLATDRLRFVRLTPELSRHLIAHPDDGVMKFPFDGSRSIARRRCRRFGLRLFLLRGVHARRQYSQGSGRESRVVWSVSRNLFHRREAVTVFAEDCGS